MITATTTKTCEFSRPITFDGADPILTNDVFFFRDSVCVETTETNASSSQPSNSTTTIDLNGQYNGASYHEWLFVAGVFLFFVSFPVWSRISFTKEK